MKQVSFLLSVAFLASLPTRGQVTITADDMFNQVGLYFLAYSNNFDPTVPNPPSYPTGNVQGAAGPNQIWDFSKGPTNVIYRFDYLSPTNVDSTVAGAFPQATIVEKQTDQAPDGSTQYLFFDQVPGVGRRVYGFYFDVSAFAEPVNVFSAPILDFPSQISFGMEWTTSATYTNSAVVGIDPTDPTGGGGGSIDVQITQTSDLKADAWGTIVLPDELGGFGQGLRINESVTIDTQYFDDTSGTFQPLDTEYARNFYWLMPGRGIVAFLASTQNSGVLGGTAAPPPDNFPTATQFRRMFQTNKKPSSSTGGCVTPDPVTDLRIRVSNSQVLLSWSKVNCATQYRLDYSNTPMDPTAWKPLSTVTNQLLVLDTTRQDAQRFYRVVSIK